MELAILITARELNQQYLWTMHELEAAKLGLEHYIIDVVRTARPLTGLGEKEAAIIQLGREVFWEAFSDSGNLRECGETFWREECS